MRRRTNLPEQLHLELQWPYLNWLAEAGEQDDFYETTSLALLESRPKLVQRGPLRPNLPAMNSGEMLAATLRHEWG